MMAVSNSDRERAYVERATRKFRRDLEEFIAEHRERGIDLRVWLGDPDEFASRAVHATAPVPSPWDDIAGPFTTSEGVQARLDVTRQAVAARAARRGLLRVITADGTHLYPIWQFDGGHVINGLSEILALFPESAVDGWTLAAWIRTPDPELGESPYDALTRGDVEAVRAVAGAASSALAA